MRGEFWLVNWWGVCYNEKNCQEGVFTVKKLKRLYRIRRLLETLDAFGRTLAIVVSYTKWNSIGWAIAHGLFGWAYVLYYTLRYALPEKGKNFLNRLRRHPKDGEESGEKPKLRVLKKGRFSK